jgi:hypothetical protein
VRSGRLFATRILPHPRLPPKEQEGPPHFGYFIAAAVLMSTLKSPLAMRRSVAEKT